MENVRVMITDLSKKSDFDIYMDVLNRDITAYKLDKDKKAEIITKAMNTACDCYNDLINKYGELNLLRYAIKLDVPIEYVNEKPSKYYAYLGLFTEKTKTITVNLDTIKMIKDLILEYGLDDIVDINRVKDAVIAHELFHYFELVDPNLYTNQKILDAKIFGIFKTKSKLMASGEIAAMHFAKLLTKLKHSPLIYNKIFSLGKKRLM